MAQQAYTSTDSPGNQLYPQVPHMRAPHLEFVYRLVAQMHPTDGYDIENVQGTGVSRSIGHIQAGTVKGPAINGIVVENSGADWAERIHSKKVGLHQPHRGLSFTKTPRFITDSMLDTLSGLMTATTSSFKLAASSDQALELNLTTMQVAKRTFHKTKLNTSHK